MIKRRQFIYFGAALFLVLLALVFRPVPQATEKNTYTHTSVVEKVLEGPSHDVVFKLRNKDGHPYINRGLDQGLNIQNLKQKLEGEEVRFRFIDHWTPLDPSQSSPTVAYIELASTGEVLYDALAD